MNGRCVCACVVVVGCGAVCVGGGGVCVCGGVGGGGGMMGYGVIQRSACNELLDTTRASWMAFGRRLPSLFHALNNMGCGVVLNVYQSCPALP